MAQILAGLLLWVSLANAALAQGPLYRERWGDLHLELLREQVQQECEGRDPEVVQQVADLLVASQGELPVQAAAQALAVLRGVAPDEAFLFRAALACFLLPEIADPDGRQEVCHDVHVSLFLPVNLPIPGELQFEVKALDAEGATVWQGQILEDLELADLRMGRPSATIPCADLADGTYRVRVEATFDGQGPRPEDHVLEHVFHVLRGYQSRVEAAQARCAELLEELPFDDYVLLHGLLLECNRAYAGEAFDGSSDAIADLQRLEKAIDNIEAERPMLQGMSGLVPLALPAGGKDMLQVVVRLPAKREADARRNLVAVVGGAPAYDVRSRRPSAPTYRTARWIARRVGDLGLGDEYGLAWIQSVGAGISLAKALPTALARLRKVLDCNGSTVLVLEREAAIAMSYSGSVLGEESVGVVLVGGGVFSSRSLPDLGALRLLGVPLTGHPSSRGLELAAAVAAGRHGDVDWAGSFELLPEAPRPWTFGAYGAREEIAAFVRACLPQK
ncbi:MAG: hypothetical protein VYE77_09080 [Planctomycetota bacterium]|nr:hypothetical protein [Planctomycetota bacterium]